MFFLFFYVTRSWRNFSEPRAGHQVFVKVLDGCCFPLNFNISAIYRTSVRQSRGRRQENPPWRIETSQGWGLVPFLLCRLPRAVLRSDLALCFPQCIAPSLMNAGLAAFGASLPRAWGRPGRAGGLGGATVRRPKGRWHGRYAVSYQGDRVFLGASIAKCRGRQWDLAWCKRRKTPPASSCGSQHPNQEPQGLVRQLAALEGSKGANSVIEITDSQLPFHLKSNRPAIAVKTEPEDDAPHEGSVEAELERLMDEDDAATTEAWGLIGEVFYSLQLWDLQAFSFSPSCQGMAPTLSKRCLKISNSGGLGRFPGWEDWMGEGPLQNASGSEDWLFVLLPWFLAFFQENSPWWPHFGRCSGFAILGGPPGEVARQVRLFGGVWVHSWWNLCLPPGPLWCASGRHHQWFDQELRIFGRSPLVGEPW